MNKSYHHELAQLAELLHEHPTVVLSGAGMSTGSGIPDYRGPSSAGRTRRPIQYREFRDNPEARTRYWARSAVGWPWIDARMPNEAHAAVAALEAAGHVTGVITQNVDGLHQRAGSRRLLELHGTLAQVTCLECGVSDSRSDFQERILALNPRWSELSAEIAPDGDAELPRDVTEGFAVPTCRTCGGVLKPNVVFFGESVPRDRVATAWEWVDAAEVLLVVGSSLTVYSGYRFVDRAAKEGKPVAIVNQGSTRGDPVADIKIGAALEEALPELVRLMKVTAA
ncbi:MAG: NAD-dependent protein deacetylase [bacterium]